MVPVWRSQSAFAIGAGYMSENGKIVLTCQQRVLEVIGA
nr:YadA-like family protein [Bartonella raoultii]